MIVENLFNSIDQGRKGLNVGLSTGLTKLDSITFGVQRKWMTTVAGDSGSISAVFISNYKDYYRAKTVKAEMLIPC